MIRATTGTWLNYATTLSFQVLFARRFGSNTSASAFVIAFGLAFAITGLFNTTAATIALPRLVAEGGVLRSGALRFMAITLVVAGATCVVLAIFAAPVGDLLIKGGSRGLSTDLVRGTAAFVVLQVIAGELGIVALARGRRFFPALAPAVPSTAGTMALLALPAIGAGSLYAVLCLSTIAEIGLLAACIGSSVRVTPGEAPRLGVVSILTAVELTLLSLVVPAERSVAALHSSHGAAQYYYASRSLIAVQQLLIGGVLLAAMPDWAALLSADRRQRMANSLVTSVVLGGMLLGVAASIALVSARSLVAFVYQHGDFTPQDTAAVARILVLALPGFCAEGVGLILSQAVLAAKRNWLALGIGLAHIVLRLGLIFVLGLRWGATGVAAAYSVTEVAVLAMQVLAVRKLGLAAHGDRRLLRDGAVVASGTLASALAIVALRGTWPQPALALGVMLVFVTLLYVTRPVEQWMVFR